VLRGRVSRRVLRQRGCDWRRAGERTTRQEFGGEDAAFFGRGDTVAIGVKDSRCWCRRKYPSPWKELGLGGAPKNRWRAREREPLIFAVKAAARRTMCNTGLRQFIENTDKLLTF
jgi:hypothetical protein